MKSLAGGGRIKGHATGLEGEKKKSENRVKKGKKLATQGLNLQVWKGAVRKKHQIFEPAHPRGKGGRQPKSEKRERKFLGAPPRGGGS